MSRAQDNESLAEVFAPARSFLFVPADQDNKVRKALDSPADAVILDLEDAVAEPDKESARASLQAQLASRPRGSGLRLVRINAHRRHQSRDHDLLDALELDAIVVPKVSSPVDVLGAYRSPVFALIESALGLRNAYDIARSPRVVGLMFGTIDFLADLGALDTPDDSSVLFARAQLVRDSIAAGVRAPVDGIHATPSDVDGLRRTAAAAHSLGMGGKLCIHPAQIAVVNEVFGPDPARLRWAERILEAHATAPVGASILDGEMIDEAVVARARRILALAE